MAKDFDSTRPLVMARGTTVNGHALARGTEVGIVEEQTADRALLTSAQAHQLFRSGVLVYADRVYATPVETPRQMAERMTVLEPLGEGRFMLHAPGRDSESIKGPDKAAERRAEVVNEIEARYRETAEQAGGEAAAASILQTDGFELTEAGSNGYYQITGPGLEEPEKVRGKANAEARLAELRAAAATSGPAAPAVASAEVAETAGAQGGTPVSPVGAGEAEEPADSTE